MIKAVATDPKATPVTLAWDVRPARPEDVPAVATGVAALLCELGATPPPNAAIEAEAVAHTEDPSLGIVLLAEAAGERTSGGELAGVLTASWSRAIQVPGRQLTIEVLWTRREFRGQGVGAALLDALDTGAARVEVGLPRESFGALRATERFYLANGFERLGPRMRKALP